MHGTKSGPIEGMIHVHITGDEKTLDILRAELTTGKVEKNGVTELKEMIKAELYASGVESSRVKVNGVFIIIIKTSDVLKTRSKLGNILKRVVDAGYIKFENYNDSENPDLHVMLYHARRTGKEYAEHEKMQLLHMTIKGIPIPNGLSHIGFVYSDLVKYLKLKNCAISYDSAKEEIYIGVKSDNEIDAYNSVMEALKAACYTVGGVYDISINLKLKRVEHALEHRTEMLLEMTEERTGNKTGKI